MLSIDKKVLNTLMISLMVAAPVFAADGNSPSADGKAKFVAESKSECSGGACHRGGKMVLSDAQLEKMKAAKNQFMDSTAQDRTQLESLHRQLGDVLGAPQIDRAKALEIQGKINSLKDKLSNAKLNLSLEQISSLTPEQRGRMQHFMLMRETMGARGRHEGRRWGGHERSEGKGPQRQEKA